MEGLESIAQSVSEEKGLTFMGQVVVRSAIVRELQVRLRLVNAFKTPAGKKSLEVPITRPVFIVGLPRTGTSIMHNMLSAGGHTRWRTPLHWELLAPVPLPDEPRSRAQQAQIDATTFELENFKELAPGMERFVHSKCVGSRERMSRPQFRFSRFLSLNLQHPFMQVSPYGSKRARRGYHDICRRLSFISLRNYG